MGHIGRRDLWRGYLIHFLVVCWVGALRVRVGLIPQASLGVGRELGYAGGKPPLRQEGGAGCGA